MLSVWESALWPTAQHQVPLDGLDTQSCPSVRGWVVPAQVGKVTQKVQLHRSEPQTPALGIACDMKGLITHGPM